MMLRENHSTREDQSTTYVAVPGVGTEIEEDKVPPDKW